MFVGMGQVMMDALRGSQASFAHPDAYAVIRVSRMKLFGLIESCDNLDWLLLTKRPENVMKILAEVLDDMETFPEMLE